MTDGVDEPGPQPSSDPEAVSAPAVSDEDRNRYGRLLDRAAERGLVDAYEYEVRLRDLAEATSIEELNRIVTELPAFTTAATPAGSGPRRRSGTGRVRSGGSRTESTRSSPWVLLAIVVAVVAVSMVLLAIFANHLAHTHNSGLGPVATASVSVPRL